VAEWSAALEPTSTVVLTFYPEEAGLAAVSDHEILSLIPPEIDERDEIRLERSEVARDWEEGWRDHFHPITIGRIRIRPPWERPLESQPGVDRESELIDVVINPGLGFGTGLHPTTRGTLQLLQSTSGGDEAAGRGKLVDAGTGSGILSVAAAKLGWDPIIAFDNDPMALIAARENLDTNGVAAQTTVYEAGVEVADLDWFRGATVLANMTLEPVTILLRRLGPIIVGEGCEGHGAGIVRLVVSGVLAGAQEQELLRLADSTGLARGRVVYEAEWLSVELLPRLSIGR
jgi:ribosomal protein L11 methyltransferase